MQNREFMERAFAQAFECIGSTSPNPAVGAVIAKGGRILSSGGTCECGSSHAEIIAIQNAGGGLAGSDMYVTLEPCCHYGKTPPCTDAIIGAGISRVFIPVLDPNPIVSGKGAVRLEEAGIDVVFMDDFREWAEDLYRPFKKSILRKSPFIVHKSAMTLDGRIATRQGDSKWISCEHSRYLDHRLRAKVDGVIVGKNTFMRDKPALTVRFGEFEMHRSGNPMEGCRIISGRDNFFLQSLLEREIVFQRNPCRIVMGIPEGIDGSDPFFADGNYILFEGKKKLDGLVKSRSINGRIMGSSNVVPLGGSAREEQISLVMEELYRRGFMFVMLEGGGAVAGSFFDAGEIDQFFYFFSPKIIGGGISPIEAPGAGLIKDSVALHDITCAAIGDDILVSGYRSGY